MGEDIFDEIIYLNDALIKKVKEIEVVNDENIDDVKKLINESEFLLYEIEEYKQNIYDINIKNIKLTLPGELFLVFSVLVFPSYILLVATTPISYSSFVMGIIISSTLILLGLDMKLKSKMNSNKIGNFNIELAIGKVLFNELSRLKNMVEDYNLSIIKEEIKNNKNQQPIFTEEYYVEFKRLVDDVIDKYEKSISDVEVDREQVLSKRLPESLENGLTN